VWCDGWSDFVKVLGGGEVHGSNPVDYAKFLTQPIQPIPECHMAAHDWATWHPIIDQKTATC
jgi:hypothetical protein